MMIAPCGLNCTDCAIYRAALDRAEAEELARKWREGGRKNAEADWFKCRGCHGDDRYVWSGDCKIRQCCKQEKRFENCSLCSEFPCRRLLEFEADGRESHREAVNHLRKLTR